MPLELRGSPSQDHVSRRSFLRAGLTASALAAVPQSVQTLFAQPPQGRETKKEKVDVSKLSPNELLTLLPREIQVESEFEGAATLEKCEVPNARYLGIIIRNVHKRSDGKPDLTPVQKIIDASDRESGRLVELLSSTYGIRCVGLEGLTPKLYKDIQGTLSTLVSADRKLEALETRVRETGSFTDRQDAERAKRIRDELLAILENTTPYDGFDQLLYQRRVQLIPTESTEAKAASKRWKKGDADYQKIIIDDREDASLEILDGSLSQSGVNRFMMIFERGHWQLDEIASIPKRAALWNRRHPTRKFSFAIITPPSIHEYDEAEKLAEKRSEERKDE